ncbi:hypothetical protein EG329_010264 [Mollisiaceae sp. DMI_Dod_QoI]|nr:hypothetical protein EG329_010264 [Helotiales sp. DMI_Dod_QoI]
MTKGQRTFALIPTTLVRPVVSRPPMTSKAAKKAYQKAQRGQKISKAEQRKRDAEEFERIKKEHDRERAAAKAKAARDKKAAKANAEREARRKQGLPEPSRFVRASQPTISKFVRADSTGKRSWKLMESAAEETDGTLSDPEVEGMDDGQPLAKRVARDQESEDEFGEFPSLSQSALDRIDSSAISVVASATGSPVKNQNHQSEICSPRASQELPSRKQTTDEFLFNDEDLADMVTTQLLSEAEAAPKSDILEQPAVPSPLAVKRPPNESNYELFGTPLNQATAVQKEFTSKNILKLDGRSALGERSINMPPPRLPLKKPSISFATLPPRPSISRQKNSNLSSKPIPILPPTSTQAFLENHMDDFFPSPTQQVRELLEDVDDLPSNTQIARELSPESLKADNFLDGLVCTQDLILSSQDLEEIITPSRAPLKTMKDPKVGGMKPPPARPGSRDRPRFFEEKDDDLLHAALHESKTIRNRGPAKQSSGAMSTSNSERFEHVEQGKPKTPRFFEEKEEDIIQAALHESKISAKQVKPALAKRSRPLTRKESSTTNYGNFNFTSFFESEEEKMLQAVIEESKKTALLEGQKVQLKEVPQKSRRTLKRVPSTATDYGDDEFSGCSQELLALC